MPFSRGFFRHLRGILSSRQVQILLIIDRILRLAINYPYQAMLIKRKGGSSVKRLFFVLCAVLMLSSALCLSASASDYDDIARELSAIGMFRGTGSGFELDRAPTRSEAAIMLVRLFGAEEEANAAYKAGKISHPFTDVSAYTSPYVAWLYSNGITKGYTATTFASQNPCSAQNYVVFLLRALGYQDGKDFAYADALNFAQTKGFYNSTVFAGSFLRDDLAALTYLALAADMADGSTYLLDSLIDSGAIDSKAAASMKEQFKLYRARTTGAADVEKLLQFKIGNMAGVGANTVKIGLGTLKGSELKSVTGEMIEAYKGIPFGTFERRFDNARLYDKNLGYFDATSPGPLSYQKTDTPFSLADEADCLNLDIWTPDSSPDELMPVYVFIHGGANTAGSSNDSWYNLTNVADDGIVCVSLNYRLGAHGFSTFRLDDGTLLANQAMSDLVVGLQWVQKYVAAFGGDPDRITIGGQSAGGYNTCYLISSPAAEGLFDRAIIQSGGDLGMSIDESIQITLDYASYLTGQEITSSQEAYEILSKTDGYQLASDYLHSDYAPDCFYILNGHSVRDGVYLPIDPVETLLSANANNVDVLVGHNEHEHVTYTHSIYPQTMAFFNAQVIRYCGEQNLKEMQNFYGLTSQSPRRDVRKALTAFGNITYLYDSYLVADAMVDAGKTAYVYRFAYGSENVTDDYNMNKSGVFSAKHSNELPFVYRCTPTLLPRSGLKLINEMHRAWTNFIKYGDPNGVTGNDLAAAWPKYDTASRPIMYFDKISSVTSLHDMADAPTLKKVFALLYDYAF